MIIASYRNGSEFIEIERAANKKYFVNYGIGFAKTYERKKYADMTAGSFDTLEQAFNAMKKHRPQAEHIKTFCTDCRFRKMLTWDSEKEKTDHIHCNGILDSTCYSWCTCKS